MITFEDLARPARPEPTGTGARKLPLRIRGDRALAAMLLLDARRHNKRCGYVVPTWRRNLSTAKLLAGELAGDHDQALTVFDHISFVMENCAGWRA